MVWFGLRVFRWAIWLGDRRGHIVRVREEHLRYAVDADCARYEEGR